VANVNANVNILFNTKQAQAQLASLQSQVNAFNKNIATSSSAAVAQQAALNKALMDGAVASRMFTARMVPVTSSVDAFTNSLEKGKFSLGQYTRFAASQLPGMSRVFKREFQTINRVAESNVRRLQTQFTAAGTAANGMAQAVALTPTALDKMAASTAMANQRAMIFNKLLRDGSTSLLNWGKNTQWAGRQLMVGFTIPLTIFAGVAAKTFKDLEAQAINFKKVYGDIFTTEAEVERNLDAVKELSVELTKYGIAVKDTMELAGIAAQSGLRSADLMAATTEATRLAVLGQMEQAEAIKTVISMQTAFQQSNEDLTESVNFLNVIENQTVLSLQDVAGAIPRVAPVIKGLGGDIKDLAVLLVAMREGGVSAAEGANALKNSLGRLISPTKQAKDMAFEFGINLDEIVNKNKGEVLPMIQELSMAMKNLGGLEQQKLLSAVFGKFQYARIGALMKNIRDDSSQAARAMDLMGMSAEDLAKTAEQELAVVENAISTKFTAAMERAKVAIAPVGELFLKAVTPILNGIASLFEKFDNLPDGVKNAIGIVAGIVGGLAPVALMVIGLLGNLLANGLKFINFLRKLFARIRGTSSQFEYMAAAEREAAMASQTLEGKVGSLTGKLLMQKEAVATLITLYGRLAGAAVNAAAAMPLSVGGARGTTVTGPQSRTVVSRGYNKGVVAVPGSGNEDIVPALLTPGESVVTKEATAKYGAIIAAMNAGTIHGFNGGLSPSSPLRLSAITEDMERAGIQRMQARLDQLEIRVNPQQLDQIRSLVAQTKDTVGNIQSAIQQVTGQRVSARDPGRESLGAPAPIRRQTSQYELDPKIISEQQAIRSQLSGVVPESKLDELLRLNASHLTKGLPGEAKDWAGSGIMPDIVGVNNTLEKRMTSFVTKGVASIDAAEMILQKYPELFQNIADPLPLIAQELDQLKVGTHPITENATRVATGFAQLDVELSEEVLRLKSQGLVPKGARTALGTVPESVDQSRVLAAAGQYRLGPGYEEFFGPGGRSQLRYDYDPQMAAAAAPIGSSIDRATRDELGINSPSVKAQQTVESYVEGIKTGVQQNVGEIKAAGSQVGETFDQSVKRAINEGGNVPPLPPAAPPSGGSDDPNRPESAAARNARLTTQSIMTGQLAIEDVAQEAVVASKGVKANIRGAMQETGNVFRAIPQAMSVAMKAFKQPLLDIGNMFKQIAEPYYAPVLAAAKKAKVAAKKAYDEIYLNTRIYLQETIPKQLRRMSDDVRLRLMEAGDKFRRLPQSIQTGVDRLRTRLNTELSKVRGRFADFKEGLPGKARGLGNKLFYGGQDLAGKAKMAGGIVGNQVPRSIAITATANKSMEMFNNGLNKVRQTLEPVSKRINDFGLRVAKTGQTISKTAQVMMNPVARSIAVAAILETKVKPAFDKVGQAVEGVRSKMVSLGAAASRGAQILANPVPRALAIATVQKQIAEAGKFVAQTIKVNVNAALAIGKAAIVDGFNNAKNFVVNAAKTAATGIQAAFNTAKTNFVSAFNKVRTTVTNEFNRISTIIRTEGPKIQASLADAARGVRGAITAAGTIMADSVRAAGGMVRAAAQGAVGYLRGGVDEQGRTRGSRIAAAGNQAAMGLMAVSMAASFAGGEIGEMAQKIMPVTMGLMSLQMLLPMLTTKMGVATLGIGALVGSFIWLRKQLDDTAKDAAKFGANLGGMANSMEIFGKATGFTTPMERSKESLFRFNAEDKEVLSEFQDFFQSEGGGTFLKELKELSSEERYSKLSSMIAQAIANGYDPEKAKQFGKAVAFEINDAMLNAKITSDISSGKFESGSRAAIDLAKQRQDAFEITPSLPPSPILQGFAQRLGRETSDAIWGEFWAKTGTGIALGAASGARIGQMSSPLGAMTGSDTVGKIDPLGKVLQLVGLAGGGAIGGAITGIPSFMQAKGQIDELNKSIEYVSATFGSSIQVLKELANAEALLKEERTQNLIGAEEFAKRQAEIRAAEEVQTQRIMAAVLTSADSGSTQQAISDQLVMAGFEGDLASAVSRAVDRQEVAQKVFGESFDNLTDQQQEIVSRLIAQTLRGINPENAADKIADIENQYSRISELLVNAAEEGLSQVDIRNQLERLQVGDWAKQTFGSLPETRTPGQIERGVEVADPRVENIMAQQDMINRLGLDLDRVIVGLSSIPDINLAEEIAGDPEKLQDFIRTLKNLQDPDLANIPIAIAVEYIYEDGLSPEQFKQQMGNVSKVFGDDTEKMIKHAKEAGIAIREFSSWGQNLKDLPQEAITRLGVEMDDPESVEKFGPFAEQVKEYWPILENLNKEIDMSAYIEYLTSENGEPVSVDEAVKRTKKLNKAWSELESAETLEARKQAIFDLRTLKDGENVSEEELTGAWDHLIDEFGEQRIFNLPTDRLNKAFAISMKLQTDKAELAKLQEARTLLAGLSEFGPEERRALNDLDRKIKILQLGISGGKADLAGTVNFGGSRDTGSGSKGGSSGGGQKNFIEQLKENVKNLEKMSNFVSKIIKGESPAFKNFIAGPFAPEFVEFLKSQGEEAVKQLANNSKKFKETYKLFIKEKALEMQMALSLEKEMFKKEMKLAQQRQNFMSGMGGTTAQREFVVSRIGDENMNTFLELDAMTAAQRKALGLQQAYKDLKAQIDFFASQAPRMIAIEQMGAFEGNIRSAKESFELFNALVARGFSPTFAEKLIDMGVGIELLGDNSEESREKLSRLIAEARQLEGIESGQNILKSISDGRNDLLATYRIMAMFPGVTQETVDAMKQMGVVAGTSAENMRTAFNGVKSAASIARLAMDSFSKSSMMVDAAVSGVQRQIERINRLEIRPIEIQITSINQVIRGLEKQIKAKQKEIKPIEVEIKIVEKQIKDIEKIIKPLEKQVKELEKMQKPIEKQLEELREREKEIQEQYDKRVKALDKIEKANQRLLAMQKAQLSVSQAISEGDIYAATRAVQEARAELAAIGKEETKTALDEDFENRRKAILDEIEAKEKDIKFINEQIEALNEQIADHQERIADLQEIIAEKQERIAAINEEIADIQERIADEQERIADLQEQIEASKQRQLELEEKIYKLQLLRSMLDTAKAIREAAMAGDVDMVRLLQGEQAANQEIAAGLDFGDLGIDTSAIFASIAESINPARISEALNNQLEAALIMALEKMGIFTDNWIESGTKFIDKFENIFNALNKLPEEEFNKLPEGMQAFLTALKHGEITFPKTAEELSEALKTYGIKGSDLMQVFLANQGLLTAEKVNEVGDAESENVRKTGKKNKEDINNQAEGIATSAKNVKSNIDEVVKEFKGGGITLRQAIVAIIGEMGKAVADAASAKVDVNPFNETLTGIANNLKTSIGFLTTTLSGTLDSILALGQRFVNNVGEIERVTGLLETTLFGVTEQFGEILENIGSQFGIIGDDFNTKFSELMSELTDGFSESIQSEFDDIVNALNIFTDVGNGLPFVLNSILEALKGFATSITSAVEVLDEFTRAAKEAIELAKEEALGAIAEALAAALAAIANALSESEGSYAGGMIPKYAMGGKIKGYPMGGQVAYSVGSVSGDGGRDSVRALLTPGEFVIRKSMVKKYGQPLFEAINQGAFAMPRYNVEEVSPKNIKANVSSANINAPVYNKYDMNFEISGANASADEIANKVMFKMKQIQSVNIRSNRGY
jgi:TP901 family phage tail tape measure protein